MIVGHRRLIIINDDNNHHYRHNHHNENNNSNRDHSRRVKQQNQNQHSTTAGRRMHCQIDWLKVFPSGCLPTTRRTICVFCEPISRWVSWSFASRRLDQPRRAIEMDLGSRQLRMTWNIPSGGLLNSRLVFCRRSVGCCASFPSGELKFVWIGKHICGFHIGGSTQSRHIKQSTCA